MSQTSNEIKGYQLQGSIGEGGFGAVYRAYQPLIKRDVAIKVIRARYANEPEFIRRFEAEAQLVARLEHLHIVPLFDFWRDPTGAYLVMRLLRGGNLKENLIEKGSWDLESTNRLLTQIASALSLAHRNGVIHRDMKPANIMLDEENNAYLTDFGIAKDVQHSDTQEEDMVGTPAYSAPEQIQSFPPTPKTDIYSLGLIIYEMLTGEQGIKGSNISELIMNQLNTPLPYIETIPDMPEGINEILQTATAKDPDVRYDDVKTFARDFKRAISDSGGRGASGAGHFGDVIVITDETLNFADSISDSSGLALTVVNPYKGLRAFQEGDSDDFFGREELTDVLLKRLEEDDANAHFLAVVGPSGSGKSSVVKAGVIPALRRGALPDSEKFFIAEMVPDINVLDEIETVLMSIAVAPPAELRKRLGASHTALHEILEEILPKDGSQLFLLIDQFEEIFTQTEDNSARTHFMNSLQYAVTHPKSRLWAIITIRADFYDKPLLYPDFGALVRQRTEVVLPLSREELEAAIVRPAQRSHVQVQRDLVEAIVSDVQEEPGALPLLQYALTELFERREGLLMTLTSYQESGGVLGSLARRAEELYTELNAPQQEAVRQLFLRLVTLGEGTEDTRRRVLWSELAFGESEDDPLHHVLATYTKFRLLTADNDPQTREPTVEVAHEALIRQWQRLRTWLSDNRENIRIQRQLASLVQEWNKTNQDSSFLATGMRLRQFETLLNSADLSLTRDETRYLEASIAQREEALREEEERQARERALEARARQFLRGLVAVMFIGVIVAAGFAVFAFFQRQDAIEARVFAENEAEINRSIGLANEARLYPRGSDEAFLGIAYAIEANAIPNPPAEVQETLAEIVWQPGARRELLGHNSIVWSAAYSPDGRYILSGAGTSPEDASMILWDAATGTELARFVGHTDRVYTVSFSPDGRLAASGSQDSSVIIWDVENRSILHHLGAGNDEGHDVDVWNVKFTPDGSQLVSGDSSGNIFVWDVATGEILHNYPNIHSGHVEDIDFSANGRLVLTGSVDNHVKVWDLASGEVLEDFLADSFVLGVHFLLGEESAVSSDFSGKIIFWDFALDNRAREITIDNATPIRGGLALTADAQTLIVGDNLGNVLFFDLATQSDRPYQAFSGHDQGISRLALSPDESELVSTSFDESLIVWDLRGRGAELARLDAGMPLEDAILSPNAEQIAASLENGNIQIWDTATMQVIQTLEGDGSRIYQINYSPDGTLLAVAAEDGSVTVWNLADATILHRFTEHLAPVRAVAFSPDGRLLAAGGGQVQVSETRLQDNNISLWDVETGQTLHRFGGHVAAVRTLAFSPDGTSLLSGGDDNKIFLWDIAEGALVHQYSAHRDTVWSLAFSPDGTRFVSGSSDTTIILWNTSTSAVIRRIAAHNTPVRAVAFSPDGQHILSGSGTVQTSSVGENFNLRYWDLTTGALIREFPGHSDMLRNIVFNAEGNQALSASNDGTIILWRVETLGDLMRRIAESYDVTCVPDATNTLCKADSSATDEVSISQSNTFPEQDTAQITYYEDSLCRLRNNGTTSPAMTMLDTSNFAHEAPHTIGYSDSGFTGTAHAWILAWAQAEAANHSEIGAFQVRDAGGDANQQIADIDSLLAEGIDILIVNPIELSNMTALESKLQEVTESGVAVVMVGFRTPTPVYTTYVGQDDYELGCVMAQELIALADGEGDIVRIHGVNESPSDTGFKAGASAILSMYPAINIINESGTGFDKNRAIELVEDNTTFSSLAAILGYTGDLALGGEEGLQRTNRPFAPVVSDHDVNLSRFIVSQNISGVQVRITTQMGATAVETALQILRGEEVSQFVRIQPELLTRTDLLEINLDAAPENGFVGDYENLPTSYYPQD